MEDILKTLNQGDLLEYQKKLETEKAQTEKQLAKIETRLTAINALITIKNG